MVTLESQLQAIVKSTALVAVDNSITLREAQADMVVTVTAGEIRVVALNMNRIGHLSAVREDRSLKRLCDFLLVANVDGTCEAILVELKKTLRLSDDSKEQLRRSLPIVKYLASVIEVQFEQEIAVLNVSYVSVFSRISGRFDKHHLRVPRHGLVGVEHWKSIRVRKLLGSRFHLDDLIDT